MTPASATTRDLRVDVVRALALISMFVAHCAPAGGPGNVLILSEYLTYPLFAALVGSGAVLADRRLTGPGGVRAWWSVLVRGAVLVGVGLLLERAGAQIVVVLVYLGLLTWVAAPLARARTSVIAGVALVAYVAAPILHDSFVDDRTDLLVAGHATQVRLLDLLVTGESYRLSSMIFFAAVGMLLTRYLLAKGPALQLRLGVVTGLAAGVLLAASRVGVVSIEPYVPTPAEHLFDALLLSAVFLIGIALATLAAPATEPVAWVGQMSLTLYAAQIYWLAYYVKTLHPGEPDDSWANVAILVVGSFVLAAAWHLVVRRGRWSRGPLEGATAFLAAPVRPSRTPATNDA